MVDGLTDRILLLPLNHCWSLTERSCSELVVSAIEKALEIEAWRRTELAGVETHRNQLQNCGSVSRLVVARHI